MMEIDPVNLGIKKSIKDLYSTLDDEESKGYSFLRGNDFDGTTYELVIDHRDQSFIASFFFESFPSVQSLLGKEFFSDNFGDFKVSFDTKSYEKSCTALYNFSLTLDLKGMMKKNKKDLIKKNRDALARMKATFLTAPFLKMIENTAAGKFDVFKFNIREDEYVWCIPISKEKISFYFLYKFTDKTEATIANLIFNELNEAKREITNAPGFSVITKKRVPKTLTDKFPGDDFTSMDENNFLINITLFSKHITTKDNSAYYLQSLRQYLHYHVQSSKTYLHSRIRKKVNHASEQIKLAKYEMDALRIQRGRKERVKFIPKEETGDSGAIILRAKK